MSWSFPPLEGVTPLGAQPPATHWGSGIVVRFDDPAPEKNITSPRMYIRMDDGGEGFEGSYFIDLIDPTSEKKFQDIAKAKWRSILEALVGPDGGPRYTKAQLDANSSGPAWVLNQRICYGFVPRGADGGEYDEFQFISPSELKAKRAGGNPPRRTEYSKGKGKKGKSADAPSAGHDAPPPATGFEPPPPAGGFTPPGGAPPAGGSQAPGGFAPPPGFGGAPPTGASGGGAAPPPV